MQDTDLWNVVVGCKDQSVNKVVSSIAARFKDRNLKTKETEQCTPQHKSCWDCFVSHWISYITFTPSKLESNKVIHSLTVKKIRSHFWHLPGNCRCYQISLSKMTTYPIPVLIKPVCHINTNRDFWQQKTKVIWQRLHWMQCTRRRCWSSRLAEVQRNSVTYRRLYAQCVYL